MKLLLDAGMLHGECKTIEGKTIKEVLRDIPSKPKENQDVIRAISNLFIKKDTSLFSKEI